VEETWGNAELGDSRGLALAIEAEVASSIDPAGAEYKVKVRSLSFNLGKNEVLRGNILTGELLPAALCAMSTEEMATQKSRDYKKFLSRESLQSRVYAVATANTDDTDEQFVAQAIANSLATANTDDTDERFVAIAKSNVESVRPTFDLTEVLQKESALRTKSAVQKESAIRAAFAEALGRDVHMGEEGLCYSTGPFQRLWGEIEFVWRRREDIVSTHYEEAEEEECTAELATRAQGREQIKEELLYLARMCVNIQGSEVPSDLAQQVIPGTESADPQAKEEAMIKLLKSKFPSLYDEDEDEDGVQLWESETEDDTD